MAALKSSFNADKIRPDFALTLPDVMFPAYCEGLAFGAFRKVTPDTSIRPDT